MASRCFYIYRENVNTVIVNLQLHLRDGVAGVIGGADLFWLSLIQMLGLAHVVLLVLLVFVLMRGASLTFNVYLPGFREACGRCIFLGSLILRNIQTRRKLLDRFIWLVPVKKHLIRDGWVRTDHGWFNHDVHCWGFVIIRHHRLSSL